MEQILNMVLRIFMRKMVNKGVNKGIDLVAGKGKPRNQLTPEEQAQADAARQTAKRARKAAQLARRMGKF